MAAPRRPIESARARAAVRIMGSSPEGRPQVVGAKPRRKAGEADLHRMAGFDHLAQHFDRLAQAGEPDRPPSDVAEVGLMQTWLTAAAQDGEMHKPRLFVRAAAAREAGDRHGHIAL